MQSTQPLINVPNKTRLQHIDIAKGIGILLVVFGHNNIVTQNDKLVDIIYSFHLPLFLFLSGLFFKVNSKLTGLILSKIDSLIKPYFLTLTIFFPLQKTYSIGSYFLGMIYSSAWAIPLPWIPAWFITHLFAIMIFSWIFIKVTKLNSLKKIIQLPLLLILLVTGFFTRHLFCQIAIYKNEFVLASPPDLFSVYGLPFSIDIIFISSFFFLLGFCLKSEVINFKFSTKIFLLFLVMFCSCHYFFNNTMNLFNRKYDDLIITTFEAISGIYIILSVSSFMSKYTKIANVCAYIGSGSLFILIFHELFQKHIAGFFHNHHNANYFTDIFAFIIASTAPLFIWELVKRNDYLSLLWLPLKSNNLINKKSKTT